MEINRKDLGITLLLWIGLLFILSLVYPPPFSPDIISNLLYVMITFFISSAVLIFYIKRNTSDYRHVIEISLIVFLGAYFIIYLGMALAEGFIDIFAMALILFLILFLASPVLLYLLQVKKAGVAKVRILFIVMFVLFLFFSGLIFFFIVWAILGLLLAALLAVFGVFWKFVLDSFEPGRSPEKQKHA